jgi:hypothetical protein
MAVPRGLNTPLERDAVVPVTHSARLKWKALLTGPHALERTPLGIIGRQLLKEVAKASITSKETRKVELHVVESSPVRAVKMSTCLYRRSVFPP